MLLDRKGRRHSIDLTNITNNLTNLYINCNIALSRPLTSFMENSINNNNNNNTSNINDSDESSMDSMALLSKSPSQRSVKTFLSHQKNHKQTNQTDLSNAFAQLILSRRNTYSNSRFYQNKANQNENRQMVSSTSMTSLKHSESIKKIFENYNAIAEDQTDTSEGTEKSDAKLQVVPNVPISQLKARFEDGTASLFNKSENETNKINLKPKNKFNKKANRENQILPLTNEDSTETKEENTKEEIDSTQKAQNELNLDENNNEEEKFEKSESNSSPSLSTFNSTSVLPQSTKFETKLDTIVKETDPECTLNESILSLKENESISNENDDNESILDANDDIFDDLETNENENNENEKLNDDDNNIIIEDVKNGYEF